MYNYVIKLGTWFYLRVNLIVMTLYMYLDLYKTLNKRKVPYCQLEVYISRASFSFIFDSSKTLTLENNARFIQHHYDKDAIEVKRYELTLGWLNSELDVIYYN